jgi:drug/metabolite transporter (DMT)-like permease
MQPKVLRTTLDQRAATILTVCCVIWGVGLVMVKISNAGLPPIFNAALRSVFATLVLGSWAVWRGIPLFRRDGALVSGIVCGLFFAAEFVALYQGLTETSASRGIVFLHCAPFVAAAGEHFLVPGHRLTGWRVGGLVAAFAGLCLALGEGLMGGGQASLRGDLLCLIGGVFWGLTTVVLKTTALGRIAAEKAVLYQLVVSASVLMAWAYVTGDIRFGEMTPSVVGAFAYTVLLTVVIGYTTWFWLMRSYSAATLHAFTFLTPIFGAMAGAVILGERISVLTMAGLGLVALGIYLVNRPGAAAASS